MRKSIPVAFFSLMSTLLIFGTVVMGGSELVLFSRYFAQERYDTLDEVVNVAQRTASYLVQEASLPEGEELEALSTKLEIIGESAEAYLFFTDCDGNVMLASVPEKLTGMKVLVDCSNGAAVRTAEELFSLLGAEATILCDAPDGTNINRECGSTHVEHLASLMAEGKYDLAVAFDGDADRCLAVDEKGHVVNGDQMIAIFARQMKAEGRLPGDAAVVTVMSSFGFFRFARENGIHAETTKVGDRYVLENMRKNGYNIGGEQSGHIIFREYMPTGDGELSAIQLMRVMKKTGEPLSVLAGRMPITPQVLLNVAADRDMKEALHESPEMEALIEECEERLGDTGRILIRASGTEPLIRVMVEGEDAALIRELAERLAAGCEKLLK